MPRGEDSGSVQRCHVVGEVCIELVVMSFSAVRPWLEIPSLKGCDASTR